MRAFPSTFALAALVSLSLMAGCTSKDQAASVAAAEAEARYQQGNLVAAQRAIGEAIAARDDVGDYWLLSARISLALQDYPGAFNAYQNVLQLDRANVEALQQLCQLGLAAREPDKVDQYADQLLLLDPQNLIPLAAKGGAALQRADSANALQFAERVLAVDPKNVNALILKGQVLAFKRDYVGATRLIEASLEFSGDQTSRLTFLRDTYPKTGNFEGYSQAVQKLAQAHAENPELQLSLADLLYQTGHPDEALTVLRRIMVARPSDIGLAASIVELWLEEGGDALTPTQILAGKALPLEMRAAFAQYANETGRPELARRLVDQELSTGEPNPGNSDAKAAAAFALGIGGHLREGLSQIQPILEVDPSQPRALLARARLLAITGNLTGAVADARQVVADDPGNITARLVLTDILLEQHENVLAESNLREAVRARPSAVRPAARLVDLLVKSGRTADGRAVLQGLARAAPLNIRVRRLLARYDVQLPGTTDNIAT